MKKLKLEKLFDWKNSQVYMEKMPLFLPINAAKELLGKIQG